MRHSWSTVPASVPARAAMQMSAQRSHCTEVQTPGRSGLGGRERIHPGVGGGLAPARPAQRGGQRGAQDDKGWSRPANAAARESVPATLARNTRSISSSAYRGRAAARDARGMDHAIDAAPPAHTSATKARSAPASATSSAAVRTCAPAAPSADGLALGQQACCGKRARGAPSSYAQVARQRQADGRGRR